MFFSADDSRSFIEENDIKFIRMSFCDTFGRMKNFAIMPRELSRAIEHGILFQSGSFLEKSSTELLLKPDEKAVSVLPWRPQSGRVVRFFCNLFNLDGTPYEGDLRRSLRVTYEKLKAMGCICEIGTRCEFYLFKTDMEGNPTRTPCDNGGYLDIAPMDKCEDARREICLALEEMGLNPTSSCHKSGPGQNEIDFAVSSPLAAADNMMHYKAVVQTIAASHGLYASFMPKPLADEIGSALKIYISIKKDGKPLFDGVNPEGKAFAAGVLRRIPEFTSFMNPTVNSYERFGERGLTGNTPVLRTTIAPGCAPALEMRSADGFCNPYLTIKLLLEAGMEGMAEGLSQENELVLSQLPGSLEKAIELTAKGEFSRKYVPQLLLENFLMQKQKEVSEYNKASDKDEYCFGLYF